MSHDRGAAWLGALAVVSAACMFGTLGPLSRLAYGAGAARPGPPGEPEVGGEVEGEPIPLV